MRFADLHHHSCFSTYDGFARPADGVKHAKKIGYYGVGLADHGTVSGLVEHYVACRDADIKPALGVEGYFQPTFDSKKEYFHMLLFAMNMEGYSNLMRAVSEANRDKFFRHPIMDRDTLKNFSAGLIATSGCVAGFIPRMIIRNKLKAAESAVRWFAKTFPDRFYIEVQPFPVYDVDEATQEKIDIQKKVNDQLLIYASQYNLPVILTLDSHYVEGDDYDTYLLKHQMGGHEPSADYTFRYMMEPEKIRESWIAMMGTDPTEFMEETARIIDRCDIDLRFKEMVPKIDWGMPSKEKLVELAKTGLKNKGLLKKQGYKERLVYELKVIHQKQFEDYFLLCYDIITWARNNSVRVGFGRGSVCGSLLAFSIGITDVDPIVMGTQFERFLRPDKTSMPDVDIDFDSVNRGKVISYILDRYNGKAAQIATFGYYKARNLANDLGKIMQIDKSSLDSAKERLEVLLDNGDVSTVWTDPVLKKIDKVYPNFLRHFTKLYGQVRFIGKHAAGVAIVPDEIEKYVAIMRVRGGYQTAYDLGNLGKLNIVKMDELGLSTMSIVKDIEDACDARFSYDNIADEKVYARFTRGETVGVFQFEKPGAVDVLKKVQPKNIQELIACNALNRPAPIQLGILDQYIKGKNGEMDPSVPWYKYTQDAYGNIIYQEHVMQICRNIGHMEWPDTDKVMKMLRQANDAGKPDPYREKFVSGAVSHGELEESTARKLYDQMTLYLFNKGHGTAYSLISFYMMWLKTYYPLEFWWASLRNEAEEKNRALFMRAAARDNIVFMLPHVNATRQTSIEDVDGGRVIRLGIETIPGIGAVSAKAIEDHRPYTSLEDLLSKNTKRQLNSKVQTALTTAKAVEFNDEVFMAYVLRYNTALYQQSQKMRG